jgi:2-dehydro-3-deoxygluconokinase
MRLKLRNNFKYSIVAPSSMGVRITPIDRQPVHTSRTYTMQATSAETNVLSVSSALGLNAKVLTKFVEDSPIAAFIKSELRSRRIDYEGTEVPQGGPWGFRHQFNIADSGFGVRGPRVLNDRAGEVGRTLNEKDFDLERIFNIEGVRILHISGLFSALSPGTGRLCLELARVAKASGTLISFDINYRASFWKGRQQELRGIFREIAALSDVLTGNEEDFQLALDIQGPEAGGKHLSSKIDGFKGMIKRAKAIFPDTRVFTTTLRQVLDANTHLWGAVMLAGGRWYVEEPRTISVLDRIGGGDAYVGGMLYGILRGWESEKCIQFGWAAGALAATMLADYCTPADEEQVWDVYKGNARVKR